MKNLYHSPLAVLSLVLAAASASAQTVTMGFDNSGAESGITTPGAQSFSFMGSDWSGGVVATMGVPALYASGAFSYEVFQSATVEFDPPVTDVNFFYVHGSGVPQGTATAQDASGAELDSIDSNPATVFGAAGNFVNFDTSEPISTIEFTGGAIDNFAYTVADEIEPIDFAVTEGGWVNRDTQGEGLMFDFGASLNALFMAWFTFPLEAIQPPDPPEADIGAPGQRWMTALLEIDGNTAAGTLMANQGGAFDSPPTEQEVNVPVGEISIEFMGCDLGHVMYTIDTAGVSGEFDIEPLEKVVNPGGFTCEPTAGGDDGGGGN